MGVYVLGVLVYFVCVCVCTCILGRVSVPMVYEQSNELFSIGATKLFLVARPTLGAFYSWECHECTVMGGFMDSHEGG